MTELPAHQTDKVQSNWITMSNAIMTGAQRLSLREKQLVALAISKIDSKKPLPPEHKIRVTADELAEAYGIDEEHKWQRLKDAGAQLYGRSIELREQHYSRRKSGTKSGEIVRHIHWIYERKYHTGEGWLEISFSPPLIPLISSLQRQFTSYQLKQVSSLRSMYSWRLLELLKRYSGAKEQGDCQIEIEDFWHAMEAPKSLCKNFGLTRLRIIEPAVKELKLKDNWLIDWQPIKRGRKVAFLHFRFARNPQMNLDL